MEKERSQYLHLYGCSPVWVRKCRVKLAERGNTLPQNLQWYRFFLLLLVVDGGMASTEVLPAEEILRGFTSSNGLVEIWRGIGEGLCG